MKQCSRRIFLKCGLGACSAGALIPPLSARPGRPYYKAVFDERFEDARAFATQATARAMPTVAIRGDVTNLFFNDLDLRWKRGPVWLIGVTTPASLFCLHLLACDRGMRLRFCRMKPNMKAVLGVLDGALPRDRMSMRLPSSHPSDLVLWIIAPSASAKESAIA
jgi:hypothetical protein